MRGIVADEVARQLARQMAAPRQLALAPAAPPAVDSTKRTREWILVACAVLAVLCLLMVTAGYLTRGAARGEGHTRDSGYAPPLPSFRESTWRRAPDLQGLTGR